MNETPKTAIVTGAGGFIGSHLVDKLIMDGWSKVIAVDKKPIDEWISINNKSLCIVNSFECLADCRDIIPDGAYIWHLAADHGGINYIEKREFECMASVGPTRNLIKVSIEKGVSRFLYTSSACVYPIDLQTSIETCVLSELDFYKINPQGGYGLEKYFSEQILKAALEEYRLDIRIARLHNVYGPRADFSELSGKAPSSISRKVIEAIHDGSNEIVIWGDGSQIRSFLYIDDCIQGLLGLMNSECRDPVNIGSKNAISIAALSNYITSISGQKIKIAYDQSMPIGVRFRSCNAEMAKKMFGWNESTPLQDGVRKTFDYIKIKLAL